jgi:hypothetical protein
MRNFIHRAPGIAVALVTVGVLAGCDADPEPGEADEAATTVASSPDAAVGSIVPPLQSTPDCALASNVRAVVEAVATIDANSSVASAEVARDELLSSVEELKGGSETLRRIDVKALNEGLAEVASAVNSASRGQTVEDVVSSLQGSARDLEGTIQEVEDHFGCRPDAGL